VVSRFLARTAVGHRQPADEVRHPGEGKPFQVRVLVQEVVEIPGLVTDHQVVALRLDNIVEHHEVVHQDRVHSADRLERVQVMLACLVLDMGRLVGQPLGRRMDPLPRRIQHSRDRTVGPAAGLFVTSVTRSYIYDGM
jgi:hypothetical protein